MIKNYITTAYRNILRQKGFSIINIIGLSLSISVCMLIIVIILDQYAYDNFHSKKDRIYRVLSDNTIATDIKIRFASSPIALSNEISKSSTLIEDFVVLENSYSDEAKYKGSSLEVKSLFASEHFFKLFDFPLRGGKPEDVLKEPFTVVLTEDAAKKIFGKDEALGNEVIIDSLTYKVTGIIPKTKYKSHIQFEVLASLSSAEAKAKMKNKKNFGLDWKNYYSGYVYFLLKKDVNPDDFNPIFDKITAEKYATDKENKVKFRLQQLTKITPGPILGNEVGLAMPKVFIYFLIGLALVIMISAAFNYTSLSIARSLLRAKEVGVRKTIGASRGQIIAQFLIEAVMIALISAFIGFVILQSLLPAFAGMKMMSILQIRPEQNIMVYLWFFIFAFVIGLISGALPSYFISAFQPIKVLKGANNIRLFRKLTLRKILLVSQFAFSMIFIITIILVYRQLNMMMNAEMGFDKKVVYNIDLQGHKFDQVKDIYSSIPEVEIISGSSHTPGLGNMWGIKLRKKKDDENIKMDMFSADDNYIETMGLSLVAGGNFPKGTNDNGKFIIVNEKAVKKLNFASPAEAIGKSYWEADDSVYVEICGVIKDYKYVALFMNSDAMVLRNKGKSYRIASLRISSPNMIQTIDKLKSEWKKIDPAHEYKGQFVNDEIKEFYSFFEDIIYTVGFATILAILIASLGLLGMATYTAQTRIKEVCIRKVYGADVSTIIFLVSKAYIWMLAIAALIAIPIAFMVNNLWLQYLAHHVDIGFGTIFGGAFIVLFIGLAAITSQTLKASNGNPADLLRYE
ncbi:MAG: FtsX-like permease family protein [Bacteroidales bacterium]|nr:MAG: FtsX-like permease family protein [Bacteroidales bacterium]